MALFKPCTTAPALDDPSTLKVPYGKNHAIEINETTHSCLPNCCGWVHARWIQLGEKESELCINHAKSYFTHKDRFKRGQTPKLGAVLCWSHPTKYGHVAICEGFTRNSDGSYTVLCSNSNYSGTRFYMMNVDPHKWPSGYIFQGYIYPEQEFTESVGTPVQRNAAQPQIEIHILNLNGREKPGTGSRRIAFVTPGIYDILEVAEADGYQWFRIEKNLWIAYSFAWADILPTDEKKSLKNITINDVSAGDLKTIQKLCEDLKLNYIVE